MDALPPEIAAATDGPAALYTEGIKSGAYRPDPLQQITVHKLQVGGAKYAVAWLHVSLMFTCHGRSALQIYQQPTAGSCNRLHILEPQLQWFEQSMVH